MTTTTVLIMGESTATAVVLTVATGMAITTVFTEAETIDQSPLLARLSDPQGKARLQRWWVATSGARGANGGPTYKS